MSGQAGTVAASTVAAAAASTAATTAAASLASQASKPSNTCSKEEPECVDEEKIKEFEKNVTKTLNNTKEEETIVEEAEGKTAQFNSIFLIALKHNK